MSDIEADPLERTRRALGECPSIEFHHFIIIVLLTVAVPFVALNFAGVGYSEKIENAIYGGGALACALYYLFQRLRIKEWDRRLNEEAQRFQKKAP